MMFYPGSGPLDGGKTLRPAALFLIIWVVQELLYYEIGEAKTLEASLWYDCMLSYGLHPSGLYRHWRGLGLHKVDYKGGDIHIRTT